MVMGVLKGVGIVVKEWENGIQGIQIWMEFSRVNVMGAVKRGTCPEIARRKAEKGDLKMVPKGNMAVVRLRSLVMAVQALAGITGRSGQPVDIKRNPMILIAQASQQQQVQPAADPNHRTQLHQQQTTTLLFRSYGKTGNHERRQNLD